MKTLWRTQHRPVLSKIVADFEGGSPTVDTASCADALRMTPEQVESSMRVLQDSHFLEADEEPAGVWRIIRVCPLAFQILGHWAPDSDPHYGSGAAQPGRSLGDIFRQATAGP